jgi:hypothetical protein
VMVGVLVGVGVMVGVLVGVGVMVGVLVGVHVNVAVGGTEVGVSVAVGAGVVCSAISLRRPWLSYVKTMSPCVWPAGKSSALATIPVSRALAGRARTCSKARDGVAAPIASPVALRTRRMFSSRYSPAVLRPGRTKVPPGAVSAVIGRAMPGPTSSARTLSPATRESPAATVPHGTPVKPKHVRTRAPAPSGMTWSASLFGAVWRVRVACARAASLRSPAGVCDCARIARIAQAAVIATHRAKRFLLMSSLRWSGARSTNAKSVQLEVVHETRRSRKTFV